MTKSFQLQAFQSKLPNTAMSIFSKMTELANRYHAINLSQGFPDFEADEKLISLVHTYMQRGYNQYAPMAGVLDLRMRIADKYQSIYHLDVHPQDEITITAGGTQGIFTIISTLIRKDDEVIIFEPAYDSYRPAIEVMGGKVVPVELESPHFDIDWAYVHSLVNERTKLIIMNNPNNPTGKVLKKEDIEALERIVQDNDLFLLSDEVYEHIVFDGKKHHSVLESSILRDRSFVVCSFGKLLHTTGWKIGYVIAPAALTNEFRKIHQFNVFSVNTPMQYAIAEYLEDISYYKSLASLFEEKRNYVIDSLKDSRFKTISSEGTYFLLLDYSEISDLSEQDFAEKLCAAHHVAMVPVSAFYNSGKEQKLLRICFAKNKDTLEKAMLFLREI